MEKVHNLMVEVYALTEDERKVLSELQPDIYNILTTLEDAAISSFTHKQFCYSRATTILVGGTRNYPHRKLHR